MLSLFKQQPPKHQGRNPTNSQQVKKDDPGSLVETLGEMFRQSKGHGHNVDTEMKAPDKSRTKRALLDIQRISIFG